MMSRRDFIKMMSLMVGYTMLPVGKTGFAFAANGPVNKPAENHLIVIMMRGAVDGLSVVIPYTEEAYYKSRPNISIPPPGQVNGAIDLDGKFGLHPALSGIMPLWNNGTLAFIHASGSPSESRSHFEAQDIMETAYVKNYMGHDGWMNRLLQILPNNNSSSRALSFSNVMPKIFEGKYNVAIVPRGIKGNGGGKNPINNQKANNAFSDLYKSNPELNALYNDAVSSHETMVEDLNQEMVDSSKDAAKPDEFVVQCEKLATMMKYDPQIQIAFMDVGGWDTHINQGNTEGQLANKLGKLGEALVALGSGLGERYRNTNIVVMSEFGRTVAENGNQGTDHGHGNVMWLLGGNVKGGKIWGSWPGLNTEQLHEGRDLAVTTDFRSIIGQVISRQFNLDDAKIASLIPDYKPDYKLKGMV